MRAFDEGERSRVSGPWLIWGIPLVLSLCGLVMIASLSLRNSMDGGEPYAQILKQARFFVFGLVLMVICALTPLKLLRRYGWILWIFSLLLVSLTLVSGIGIKVGGGPGAGWPLDMCVFSLWSFCCSRCRFSWRTVWTGPGGRGGRPS